SGRRTAIVNAGPDKGAEKAAVSLRAKADDGADDEAKLQTGSGRRTAIVNAGPDKGAEKAAVSLRAKADDGAD
ncbi:hypothetical protein CTI14_70850, partial [Methylobacterium radiotolerans]